MGAIYTASMETGTVTTNKTLAYITAPSTKVVRIISAYVSSPDNDTNEQMHLCFQRITTLGTPTATTVVAVPHAAGYAAAGSTVKFDVTASEPTYTSATEFGQKGAPSLSGWMFEPSPPEYIEVAPSANIGLRLITTVSSTTLTVSITFEELG